MTKKSKVAVQVDAEIKEQAEIILNTLGLTMTGAINIFFRQIVIQNGFPLEMKLSNINSVSPVDSISNELFDMEIKKAVSVIKKGKAISTVKDKQAV